MLHGSCIGGPVMEKYNNSPVRHYQAVTTFAGKRDFVVLEPEASTLVRRHSYNGVPSTMPSEAEIAGILAKTGKTHKEDELSTTEAAACNTCREKGDCRLSWQGGYQHVSAVFDG